jgi:type IV pilus assembly protein PilA
MAAFPVCPAECGDFFPSVAREPPPGAYGACQSGDGTPLAFSFVGIARRGGAPMPGDVPMKMQRGFTLIELMIVVAIIAILAAIAISQYQDYLIRSQVSEASSLADGAKTAVAEYYNNFSAFAGTQASYGLAQPASITGKYVASVDVAGSVNGGQPGQIVVKFKGALPTNAKIFGQTLTFSPVVHDGSIEWVCNPAAGLNIKYVPSACRD